MKWEWETVHECPMCGENNASFYGQGHAPLISDPRVMGGAPMAVVTTYATCNICGLIFQVGRLTEASLADYYESGTYRASIGTPPDRLDWNEKERAAYIAPLVGPGSHLDVGCSRGYLLAATRAKGCEVYGVEPFAEYVTEDVPTVGSLADVVTQFDTVTSIHSLEHMRDPFQAARDLMACVKPGGHLIVEVPSDQSPGGPLRLAHLYHFQAPVLRRVFQEMSVEKFMTTPHNLFIFRKD